MTPGGRGESSRSKASAVYPKRFEHLKGQPGLVISEHQYLDMECDDQCEEYESNGMDLG